MHAGQVAPAFVAIEAVQDDGAQVGRETGKFGGPVRHQSGRHDNERGAVEAAVGFLDDQVGDGLCRLAEAHVVGQQPAEAGFAQVLQPVDAVLLVWSQGGVETGWHRRLGDLGDGAEAGDPGGDGGAVLPACGDQILQVEHVGGGGGVQHHGVAGGASGCLDQIVHHREQSGDAFGRQPQDAPVVEAGDDLTVDDPGGCHAAAFAQAHQDRQQRVAGAFDLDAEIEREAAVRRVGDPHVAEADGFDQARAELAVDAVAPTQRLECGEAVGDETLPGLGGVAATEDEHQPALCPPCRSPCASAPGRPGGWLPGGGLDRAVAAHEDRAVVGVSFGPLVRTNWRSSSNGTIAPS